MKFTAADVLNARRELARRSLNDFACMVDIPTVPLTEADEEDRFSVMKLGSLAAHHDLILRKLQGVENGTVPNLMLLLPPGSAKSTYADVVFVPWFMSRKPRRHVILASYASNIAAKQGRRARQLIKSPSFLNLTGRTLDPSKTAGDEWVLDNGSEYMAGGILSGLTGNRAALGILDDPIRGREAAESATIRDKTWDAYVDDFCSRLIPGAPQVMILCMTGDTPVLMGDGAHKALREIRPGDEIATYDNGVITKSRVMNWANQGPDSVFEIKMSSGISVRANERHPFLVERSGRREWIRLKNINAGDRILRVIGANGVEFPAPLRDVSSLSHAAGCVESVTEENDGQTVTALRQQRDVLERTSSYVIDMELALMSTKQCSSPKKESARFAGETPGKGRPIIGRTDFALTTITKPEPSEDCSVTIVTSSLDEGDVSKRFVEPLNTWSVTTDEVLSILPCGREDVFDIQVEGTENFIANGLVSHNTRWHQEDPAGRILPEDWDGESGVFEGRDGRIWHVVCLPAIADRADDPLGRKIGETLWPEWFTLDHWKPFQKNPRTWTSLYQQKPTAQEGTYFKREWFKRYGTVDRPTNLRYYMTSDHAPSDSESSDYNVFRVWGIDANQHIWEVDGHRHHGTIDGAVGIDIDPVTGEQSVAEKGALALIRKWKPLCWFPEADNNWRAASPFIMAAMRKHKIRCRIEPLSTAGDKSIKAQAAQAKAFMGEVHIRSGFEGDQIVEEYVAFPGGRNDDEVDALANIGRVLDQAHPAIVPPAEITDNRPRDRYSRQREEPSDGGFYA